MTEDQSEEYGIVKASDLDASPLGERNKNLHKRLQKYMTASQMSRNGLEQEMDLVTQYVRPNTSFHGVSTAYQTIANKASPKRVYDLTAQEANMEFASQMHSYMNNPSEDWFNIASMEDDVNPAKLPPDVASARARIRDIMHKFFNLPNSGFFSASHEYHLDLSGYGNSLIVGEKSKKYNMPIYRCQPFTNVYFGTDELGIVDKIMFRHRYKKGQLFSLTKTLPGGLICLPDAVFKAEEDTAFEVVRAVFPREEYKRVAGDSPLEHRTRKKWAYVYWMPENNCVIYEGGFDELPYFPGRLFVFPGEDYGTGSPSMVIPVIMNLQTAMRHFLLSGALNMQPPMWAEEDSIISSFDGNITPGQLLKGSQGSSPPTQLGPSGSLEYTEYYLQTMRQSVRKAFWLDDFQRETKKERQTLGEVTDTREEMLRGLSPVFGRGSNECFYRMIRWHFLALVDMGHIDKPLAARARLNADNFLATLIGPIARAHNARTLQNVQLFMQDLSQVAGLIPESMDGLDGAAVVQQMARSRSVTDIAILSDTDKKKKKQAREEMEQGNMQAQQALQTTQAMKNVASAQKDGLGL